MEKLRDKTRNSEETIEVALKELIELKRAIDEHSIVAITDTSGTITYANDKFCEISKYSRDELLGANHRIINSGYHPESFFKEMYQTIAKGETWRSDFKNRAKDGNYYWVDTTISPIKNVSGKIIQYIAIRTDITKNKEIEEELIGSVKNTQSALGELTEHKRAIDQHSIVAITDTSGTITYANDKFCEISKYSRDELIGANHRIINSGHHPESFFKEMYQTIANGKTWRSDFKNCAKDGSYYWVDTTISPINDVNGKIIQYIAIRTDITKNKEVEEKLAKSFRKTENALGELTEHKEALDEHSIVAITDTSGTIIYANDKFCEISKYKKYELIGANHRIINSGYHPDSFFTEMYKTIAKGKVWRSDFKNRAKDGSYYWVDTTISPIENVDGKIIQYIAIRTDITKNKAVEEELLGSVRSTEIALGELTEHKQALDEHSIVAITDTSGTITYANDKFCEISKYSRDELIGANHRIINSGYHPESFFKEMYQTIAKGKTWRSDFKNRAKDGAYYWVDTTISPIKDVDGKIIQYIAIRTDITKNKAVEEALIGSVNDLEKANIDLKRFAYVASHDLQEPLRKLQQFSNYLEQDCSDELSEDATYFLSVISASSSRMSQLIKDLLSYSRTANRDLKLVEVGLSTVVDDVISDLEIVISETNANIKVEKLPVVTGDRAALDHLMRNLIGNAIKYHHPERAPEIEISTQIHSGSGDTEIRISDNGIGLDMQYRERIFEPFQRLQNKDDYPGSGIGLAICNTICQRLGWKLDVDSEVGKGSVFSVVISTTEVISN